MPLNISLSLRWLLICPIAFTLPNQCPASPGGCLPNPRLRSLCESEIDLSSSCVYVRSTNDLVDHIHAVANEIIADREGETEHVHDEVSAGATMRGSVLYPAQQTT